MKISEWNEMAFMIEYIIGFYLQILYASREVQRDTREVKRSLDKVMLGWLLIFQEIFQASTSVSCVWISQPYKWASIREKKHK